MTTTHTALNHFGALMWRLGGVGEEHGLPKRLRGLKKNLPAMQEIWVQFLSRKEFHLLEEGTAIPL